MTYSVLRARLLVFRYRHLIVGVIPKIPRPANRDVSQGTVKPQGLDRGPCTHRGSYYITVDYGTEGVRTYAQHLRPQHGRREHTITTMSRKYPVGTDSFIE